MLVLAYLSCPNCDAFAAAVPQQELGLLLATGSCSPPLHNFLGSTLGEAGLRRLARGTDAALNSLHTAILERLMPLAELVLFLLGELRGAVLAAGAESWMGLQVGVLGRKAAPRAFVCLPCCSVTDPAGTTGAVDSHCNVRPSACAWVLCQLRS